MLYIYKCERENQSLKQISSKNLQIPRRIIMIISDLNNLEAVQGNEVFGGYRNVNKSEKLSSNVRNKFKGKIKGKVKIKGNGATAEADAGALGPNTFTDTFTDAYVEEGAYSGSSSKSIAGTNH